MTSLLGYVKRNPSEQHQNDHVPTVENLTMLTLFNWKSVDMARQRTHEERNRILQQSGTRASGQTIIKKHWQNPGKQLMLSLQRKRWYWMNIAN